MESTVPKYSIAISFAGEDRPFAEDVAQRLKNAGIAVFYDQFEQHDLWGKDLYETLRSIYTRECRYCLLVLTSNYLTKMWAIFERRQIIDRLAHEHGSDCVLPVRLDGFDEEIPGLSGGIGYLSCKSAEAAYVVEMLSRKLASPGYEVDSTVAFERAIEAVKRRNRGYLNVARLYTSAEHLSKSYGGFSGVSTIHGWLGHTFIWSRARGEPLRLLAENKGLEKLKNKGLVEICLFDAPEAWTGCGYWEVTLPQKVDPCDLKEGDELVLSLYLYSIDPDGVEALRSSAGPAAFLAGLALNHEDAAGFFDLAESKYEDLR
ncbi:MAG: TIR domain-containing protein [Nevskiales bacterium]|nr:TIR domain-containing protein [Nevskiales bacterium]